jgi:AcrR family transcriptional regulator
MVVNRADLTALARIRDAALKLFADRGEPATSIRDVARAADVSPGLVQHYFASKAELRAGVNQYVAEIAAEAFRNVDPAESADVSAHRLGERIAGLVADHPDALRYVARSVIDGDQAALGLFDAFVGTATDIQRRLAEDGMLDPDLDMAWSALNVVLLNLVTVLFEPAVNRHLPEPFFSPEGLQRWQAADTELFRRAFYRQDPPFIDRKPAGRRTGRPRKGKQ